MALSDNDLNLPTVADALAVADQFHSQLAQGDTVQPRLVGKGIKELVALSIAYRALQAQQGGQPTEG